MAASVLEKTQLNEDLIVHWTMYCITMSTHFISTFNRYSDIFQIFSDLHFDLKSCRETRKEELGGNSEEEQRKVWVSITQYCQIIMEDYVLASQNILFIFYVAAVVLKPT